MQKKQKLFIREAITMQGKGKVSTMALDENKVREEIMLGTLRVYNSKGLKFTMDEVAKELGMSKKTIYKVYDSKDELFMSMVDYVFGKIAEKKEEVLYNDSLSTLEKIRKIMSVMPENYEKIDFSQLYSLKDKYPKIYSEVEKRLETGWETTISLLQQGMKEGCIKEVSVPLVKLMMESSLEQFFQKDILVKNGITYNEALQKVVDILIDGIAVRSLPIM